MEKSAFQVHSCSITFWSFISTWLQSWSHYSEWQGTSYLVEASEWNVDAWDFYQKKMLIDIYVQIWINLNISQNIAHILIKSVKMFSKTFDYFLFSLYESNYPDPPGVVFRATLLFKWSCFL